MSETQSSAVAIQTKFDQLKGTIASGLSVNGRLEDMINIAQRSAMANLPAVSEMTAEEKKVYQANVNSYAAKLLLNMSEKAVRAFHMLVWKVLSSGEWTLVRLPRYNEYGEVLTDEDGQPVVEAFSDPAEWYEALVDNEKFNRASASVIRQSIFKLLPALKRQEIFTMAIEQDEDGKTLSHYRHLQPEDIFAVGSSNLEVSMKAIQSNLALYQKTNDQKYADKIVTIVDNCASMTKEELKKWLSQAGERGDKVKVIPAYSSALADGRNALTLLLTESQEKFINGILSGRLEVKSAAIDEIGDILSDPPAISDEAIEDHAPKQVIEKVEDENTDDVGEVDEFNVKEWAI